jgi:dipeptidyl aminopeptidase/acylaminoacyl peptidase
MKLYYIFIFLLFFLTSIANAQEGVYVGKLNYGNSSLDYQIDIEQKENQLKVFFSSIEMNAYKIPALNVSYKNDALSFYIVSDFYTYEYNFEKEGNKLIGKLKVYTNSPEQLLNTFETSLIKNETDISIIEKEEITFQSNGLQLKGTIWKPKTSNKRCLFYVTSSQGNDRSATSAEALYFANKGFVVFHYDKRGTGRSEGNWESATIEELASDDVNALLFVSKTIEIPLSKIGIKGSSQGAIKIPYILSKLPQLKFGISVSCPGGTLLESDLNFWRNSNINQIGKENINIATKAQKASYEYLAGITSYKAVENIQKQYGNQSWFKYIWIPKKDIAKDKKLNFSGLTYFKKVTQPVLVIQGLSDNVIPENSYKVIDKALKKAGNKEYEIAILKNTTHSMTIIDAKFPYFQKLESTYLSKIAKWVDSLKE